MDEELKCDFFIGDKLKYQMKKMNYNELKGFKNKLKYKLLVGNFYWQRGAISLSFKPYKFYIITGDLHCVSTWTILIFNRLQGKKTFLWSHGWYGDESGIKKAVKGIFFKLSSHVLLFGNYAKELMIKEGVNREKLSIIYNSLDYDRQMQIRYSLKNTGIYSEYFKNNFPTLIFIGRIQPTKRLDWLLSAIEILDKRGVQCNLVLVGEPVDGYSIEGEVSKYNIGKRVWLYGPTYDEECIGELISNADICISPGNVGLTSIHSLMYGTSVITHNNFCNQGPEFEAITEGKTGKFFKEGDVEDLSNKILDWLYYLKNNREKVRQACYKIVEEKYNPYFQIGVIKNLLEDQKNKG